MCMLNANAVLLWPHIVNSWTLLHPEATCGQHEALSVCTGYVTDSKSIGRSPTLYSHLSTPNMCIEAPIRQDCKANCLKVSSVEAKVPEWLIYTLPLYETITPYYIDPLMTGVLNSRRVDESDDCGRSETLCFVWMGGKEECHFVLRFQSFACSSFCNEKLENVDVRMVRRATSNGAAEFWFAD